MISFWHLTALAALLVITFATAFEEDWASALLKRQAPGTPAYNCHLDCGTAITVGRESTDRCTNSTFLDDYQACLDCAGPSNQDIWQFYGGTLSGYGESCGLSTTPVSNTSATTTSTSPSTPESASSLPATTGSTVTLSTSTTELPQSSTTAPRNSTTSTSTGTSSSRSPSASSSALVPVTGSGSTSKGSFYGLLVLVLAAVFAGLV